MRTPEKKFIEHARHAGLSLQPNPARRPRHRLPTSLYRAAGSRPAAFLLAFCLASSWVRGNLAFNFTPDAGTPQYVIDGFNAAAARWSAVLANDMTVNLDIGWQSLSPGVLGVTSYTYVQEDYSAVRAALMAGATSADDASAYSHLQSGPAYSRLINHTADSPNGANSATPYVNSVSTVNLTRPNARVLGFFISTGGADASIRFNSNIAFDFNPADGVTPGQYDFATVASHEIGHALGFASVVNVVEQGPYDAAALPATALDLFRFSAASVAAGAGINDCTADSRAKYLSANGGATSIAPFSTGVVYGNGYQADHWQDFSFTGLMDPQSFTGLQRRISATDLRAFDLIGYAIPEPGTGSLALLAALLWAGGARRRVRTIRG